MLDNVDLQNYFKTFFNNNLKTIFTQCEHSPKAYKMVMHRALFTWFVLLVFFIFLCLRLESKIHWNWFLTFFPMWGYDLILLIDAFLAIIMHCKDESFRNIVKNKNNLIVLIILLKIAAQILICLKLEYKHLQLEMYHVLIPFWILLPLCIADVSISLFKNNLNY